MSTTAPEVIGMALSLAIVCVLAYYAGEAIVAVSRACYASFRAWAKPSTVKAWQPRRAMRRGR